MKKVKETICFTKNGIDVYVKIDYVNNRISLVEPLDVLSTCGKFKVKKYGFVERGVEYINGWLNILDAMKYAMEEAKKMYKNNELLNTIIKNNEMEKNIKTGREFQLEGLVKREYKRINP